MIPSVLEQGEALYLNLSRCGALPTSQQGHKQWSITQEISPFPQDVARLIIGIEQVMREVQA